MPTVSIWLARISVLSAPKKSLPLSFSVFHLEWVAGMGRYETT